MTPRPTLSTHTSHRRQSGHTSHQALTTRSTTPSLSRTSSGPGTPRANRGDLPSKRSTANLKSAPTVPNPQNYMEETQTTAPATPTPRKARKTRTARGGAGRSEQRHDANGYLGESTAEDNGEEDLLNDLLGITTPESTGRRAAPAAPAVEETSAAEATGAKKTRRGGRSGKGKGSPLVDGAVAADGGDVGEAHNTSPTKPVNTPRRRQQRASEDQEGRNSFSEGEVLRRSKRTPRPVDQKRTEAADGQSLISATKPAAGRTLPNKQAQAQPISAAKLISPASEGFDMSSLSQSLPGADLMHRAAKARGGAKVDESSVWDMPEGPAGPQELTWQQRLSSTDSTPRKKAAGDKKLKRQPATGISHSPLNPGRPDHTRRLSSDAVTNLNMSQRSLSASASAIDSSTLPWHASLNANRPPQTPSKAISAAARAAPLPLIAGDFPRIRAKGAQAAAILDGGSKYAGPTFHNSPSAHSLAKPDLDEF